MLNALFRHEAGLWALAVEHFGVELTDVLQGCFDRAEVLDSDAHYVWRKIPALPLLPHLAKVRRGPQGRSPLSEVRGQWTLLDVDRLTIFHGLVRALPVEKLPAALLELRLELDLAL